jgi:mono/diheme cytochrome c family protein
MITGLALLAAQAVGGAEDDALVAWGKDVFIQRCASCHGEDGKGNGPVAEALKHPPADLTNIKLRHGGQFPRAEMRRFIDGERPVPAHGPRHMPVWGEVFRGEKSLLADSEARMRIHAVTTFLESIQQP